MGSKNIEECGMSVNKPPFFKGNDYAFWKQRMKFFLNAHDPDLWRIIEEGPYKPVKTSKNNGKEEEFVVDKTRDECIEDIWRMLEVKHEGTDQVQKILRSLPKKWDAKATTIQESKNLKTLPLEELIGSKMTHELKLKTRAVEEEDSKKKSIALTAAHGSRSISEDENEENIALLARNIRKFVKYGKRNCRREKASDRNKEREETICYKCGQAGQIKPDCPKLKKPQHKEKRIEEFKKALKSTWDSSESESSDDEDIKANLCLVAKEESHCNENEKENACYRSKEAEILNEITKLKMKLEELNDELKMLRNHKCEILLLDNVALIEELASLEIENKRLEECFQKFNTSSEKLNLLLSSQKPFLDKTGIGYSDVQAKETMLER
ncbi:uncharacterized protein LOC120003582 [Tripterygium wilfordii]|uniref:uncharacterized protein LOC120003582 n=1 Tax=Tripterygium wilfordii TaxID=458696 RepID=UPI0018F7FFA9|nr:uncharacterized protein LOC120003582 [Tripterygium wilfordii]